LEELVGPLFTVIEFGSGVCCNNRGGILCRKVSRIFARQNYGEGIIANGSDWEKFFQHFSIIDVVPPSPHFSIQLHHSLLP
jgi:hypothetical protein